MNRSFARTTFLVITLIIILVLSFFNLNHFDFKPIAISDVPGTYVGNFGDEPETVQLKGDGTYIHHFVLNGKKGSDANKWTFDENSHHDETRLTLENFTMGSAWHHSSGICGFWPPEIFRWNGKLRLKASEDEDLYFEKK